MKKRLIQSFIILSASSAITKLFSILNRMMLARMLTSNAMALYILVMPTLSLCITLGQMGIPSAVFRLLSNPTYNRKKVMISALFISIFTVLVVVLGLLVSSKYIAYELLKNKNAFLPMLSLIPFIPLVCISGILKNYFLARQNTFLVAKAQFIEEVARLIFTYVMIRSFHHSSISILISFAFLSMSVGEGMSILYMLYRLKYRPAKYIDPFSIWKESLLIKDVLNIAMPLTGSRLYHCFTSFLEPITLTFVLTSIGLSKTIIHQNYAIISGYVISLLVTPTFFNNVIYRLFLPIITKDITNHNKLQTHRHLMIASIGCIFIALPFSLIFYFYPEQCLKLIYNTTDGANYLKYLSIPFTLFYLQTPLSAILHALNKNKLIFFISFVECTLEIILVYFLAFHFQVLAIAMSLLIGMFTTLFLSIISVYYYIYVKS